MTGEIVLDVIGAVPDVADGVIWSSPSLTSPVVLLGERHSPQHFMAGAGDGSTMRPPLKLGAFFFGGVEPTTPVPVRLPPMDRRISNEQVWKATTDYISSAMEAERLGYDSFRTTEHHFQHEGYEVIPNGIHVSTWIAARTNRLRLGTMFNVVPQWNPLRLAEDFATLHNLSGGRGILGVGRGTVPREVLHLNDKGVSIGSYDNPDQAADDDRNRRAQFEESMDIVRAALTGETFAYEGEFFHIPVPGIPTGAARCSRSRRCCAAVPVRDLAGGHQPADARVRPRRRPRGGLLEPAPRLHQALLGHVRRAAVRRRPRRPRWRRTSAACSRPCASRTPTRRRWRRRRPATTSSGSSARTGGVAATWGLTASRRRPGLIPTLAESIENKTILVGTPDEVAEGVAFYRDLLGLEHLTIFPYLLGDPYKKADEQMARFIDEVASPSSAELVVSRTGSGGTSRACGRRGAASRWGGADADTGGRCAGRRRRRRRPGPCRSDVAIGRQRRHDAAGAQAGAHQGDEVGP